MRFLGIIPDEIIHEFLVEAIHFVKFVRVPVDVLLLNRSVESFQVAIRLRMMRVVEEVSETAPAAMTAEVVGEFTAVIGLHPLDGERSDFKELPEEIRRR